METDERRTGGGNQPMGLTSRAVVVRNRAIGRSFTGPVPALTHAIIFRTNPTTGMKELTYDRTPVVESDDDDNDDDDDEDYNFSTPLAVSLIDRNLTPTAGLVNCNLAQEPGRRVGTESDQASEQRSGSDQASEHRSGSDQEPGPSDGMEPETQRIDSDSDSSGVNFILSLGSEHSASRSPSVVPDSLPPSPLLGVHETRDSHRQVPGPETLYVATLETIAQAKPVSLEDGICKLNVIAERAGIAVVNLQVMAIFMS
ncbi:hypothetical protein HDU96_003710, partial [Phlyctochytrium bullatum]